MLLEMCTVGEVGGSLTFSLIFYGIPFALGISFSFLVFFDTFRRTRD